MKVLHLIDGPGWSGGVEQTLLLARGLAGAGFGSVIGCHRDNATLLTEARAAGIPVIGFEETGRHKLGNYRRALGLFEGGIDVVIAHKPRSILYALLAQRVVSPRPRVIAVRRVSRRISRLSSLSKYRLPDRVVAVSESVAEGLTAAGVPREKIRVVPSGVDLARFHLRPGARAAARRALGAGDATWVVMHVANFTPRKGHRVLMEALSMARETLGPFRLVLAGHGTEGTECRALAASFGLRDELLGLGLRRDVELLLPAADLFAFPSLPGIEAIAGSLLQAMAVGLPALASNVGGIPEYLREGATGWLAPPGDAPAWAEKLRALRAMPAGERERVATSAASIVHERYSIEGTVRAYVEILTDLRA